jgi:hypothetical protein
MAKKNLINSYRQDWRKKDPLCRILRDWSGKENGDKRIDRFATQPLAIREVLEKIVKIDTSPEAVEFERVKKIWQKVMPPGGKISAFPFYIKDSILFVKVTNSCSMMEMRMQSSNILKKIKDELIETSFSKMKFLN